MTTTAGPYRVAQWATGTIGMRSLRAVLEHPDLALAGVYSHSAAKIGRDAGELCGLPATGIRATNDVEAIGELGVDCVLYMPRAFDQREVIALLTAGTNVVTTCGLFHHPPSMDPALRERIETACSTGNSSIHSTGSSPGFITEALPLVLASVQRRVDSLTIDEYADLSQRHSPEMLFQVMGFGQAPAAFDQARADYLGASFGPSLRLLADAFGIPVESVTAHGRTATARRRTSIAAGTIEAGTVAAQQITVTARSRGSAALCFRATWYCTTDIDAEWHLRETGWHLDVAGDAPLDIDIRFPFPLSRMAEISPGYTANRAVNAVPALCAAPPGIRTTLDLPHFVGAR
ncbi:NAD(P)H-dependent amine dehydrogenase family protein [Nocardia goodfellowii]|uniref:4-hydroxy-tetrahydrodipicolinate reductase n=1 Tax=Nocardia goodfellowii TaxID=882446 RepID=A0ABS4QJV3_9NOCA|nr:dihydrodipicolinate reductase [Nocardia goodfellowii]MBP2191989.1 4-hydroxy-tetrahydrodipicolinate reductase [Nocardia goodfellowii]